MKIAYISFIPVGLKGKRRGSVSGEDDKFLVHSGLADWNIQQEAIQVGLSA